MAQAKRPRTIRGRPPKRLRAEYEHVLELFRAWGRQGGQERAKRLSAEARREGARKAARARWKAKKGRRGPG